LFLKNLAKTPTRNKSSKTPMRFLITIIIFTASVILPSAWADAPVVPAEPALAILKKANVSYASTSVTPSLATSQARETTASGQHPIAVIVGCSDSRTPPEILFQQNLGRLFVVRTAGNVVDDIALGSIEYAVEHLGVRLVVVLGHTHCGAVKATVAGAHVPPHIASIVRKIRPAVELARKEKGDLLENSIQANARRVADTVRHDSAIPKKITGLKVVPAVYDIQTGRITWFE
jgi:carbonic anhydrase